MRRISVDKSMQHVGKQEDQENPYAITNTDRATNNANFCFSLSMGSVDTP